MSARGQAESAAFTAANSTILTTLARAGYAASGLVHLLLGYLAIRVALHDSVESDQSGALAEVSKLPGGVFILWLTVVGLAALGLWLIVQGALGLGSSSKKRIVRSLVALAKAAAYLALCATALTFAQGHSTSAGSSTRQTSGSILSLPGGQVLLGLVGVLAIGVGGYFVVKGMKQKFKSDINVPTGRARGPVIVLGVAGYVAKGVAVAIVGILFIVAAATFDPKEASGLDGALKSLAALPFGAVILIAVGVGLIAYGVYTFARVRLARL
ncbi:MAG: hypothetical protein JWP70_1318 [Leifsonia sp.]|jgi:hypothetical protein|nr:hypothetical protein [Leifsonia sp.]